ncbi:unnamed protein product [Adineta steineri]|uniref:Hexosyltransferase n=1 Tax=Adineta steineri TaxID=433720 RepID=A0A818Q7Y8_9BILA|nr:unnamed protein product [Adineta steineri]CAF3637112.1 unnamed protein product [Adineta steineri]
MWLIRRHRSSTLSILLSLILSVIFLYITFYDKKFTEILSLNRFELAEQYDSSSVEYFRVQLDLTIDHAVCQVDDFLIIYILSSATNFGRRNVIRSTWGSKRNGTCFVFIIGEIAGATYNIGSLQVKLNNERRQYHDIVQVNHIETYANVVYKEVAALQWSSQFYPNIPYLFKTDDDLIIDSIIVSFMAEFFVTNNSNNHVFITKHNSLLVSHIAKSDPTTFFRSGWPMDYQPTGRGGGKFSINETIWPYEFLPSYCSGFGWFMSNKIRDKLLSTAKTYPLNRIVWIGDVFASGFLAKAAHVKCTRIPIDYDQPRFANCSCLFANNPILTVCGSTFHAGRGGTTESKYDEYRKSWEVIQSRHNSTQMITVDC